MMISVEMSITGTVAQFLEVILLAWFYASPVIYPLGRGLIPERMEAVIRFNPLAGALEIFHSLMYYGTWPGLGMDITFRLDRGDTCPGLPHFQTGGTRCGQGALMGRVL